MPYGREVEQYHRFLQMRGSRPSGAPIPPYPAHPPPLTIYVEYVKAAYNIPSKFSSTKSTDPNINMNDPDIKCKPDPDRSSFQKNTSKFVDESSDSDDKEGELSVPKA
jgi:hypothetical protein